MFDEDLDDLEQLNQLKPIRSGDSEEKLFETLGVHRAAILAAAGNTAEVREMLERMKLQTQELLRQAKREARAEMIPLGDAALLDARYVRTDGMVLVGRTAESIELPDGTTESFLRHGFLTDPNPVVPEQLRARNAHAAFTIAFHRAKRIGGQDNVWRDPFVRQSFLHFRKVMLAVPGRTGEYFRSMFANAADLKRVISNATGTGAELVLTPTMANIRRPAELARRIPGLFRTMEVRSPSFKQPIVTGRALATRRGATSNTPAQYPISTFATSDVTLTVVDQVIMALLDPLWISDASQIIEDPMGLVLDWLDRGYIDSLEIAHLHGDTNAGGHQDTIGTWTMGGLYTAGQLDGTAACTKWWIGARGRAYDDATNATAGGTFSIEEHFGALEPMGVHADKAVAITGLHCLYTQLLPYTNFLTTDKMGAMATIVTGEIGKLGKTPLILSEMVPNDFANTGLYTGSGSTTEIVYVDPEAYTYYEYNGGSDDFDQAYPDKGAQYVGMVRRGVLAPTCLSTEKPAAVLYNL